MENHAAIGEDKAAKFWDWFKRHHRQYLTLHNNGEVLFAALGKRLSKVDERLTFEMGPVVKDGPRELIISADGIKSAFPLVQKMVALAPELSEWKITAFRPARRGFSRIGYRNIELDMKDVFFSYERQLGKIAVELNIKGYKDNDDWSALSLVLLDTILGEYDTEMFLSWIDRKNLDDRSKTKLRPISELPAVVKRLKLELWN